MRQSDPGNLTYSGYYSGPGSITKFGPGLKENQTTYLDNDYDFSYKPMGVADRISKEHDFTQETTIHQPQGWLEDVRTLPSDHVLLDESEDALFDMTVAKIAGHSNTPTEDYVRISKMTAFFSMVIAYKEWKYNEMLKRGLDPDSHRDQNKIIIDDWQPSSMSGKIAKLILEMSGPKNKRGEVKPIAQKQP